jgi:hypothetical protein
VFENIISYKCKCNTKTHKFATGEHEEEKPFNKSEFEKIKCLECKGLMKVQKAEQLTVKDNKITRKIIGT